MYLYQFQNKTELHLYTTIRVSVVYPQQPNKGFHFLAPPLGLTQTRPTATTQFAYSYVSLDTKQPFHDSWHNCDHEHVILPFLVCHMAQRAL